MKNLLKFSNISIASLFVLFAALALISCEKDYAEPNTANAVADNLALGVQKDAIANNETDRPATFNFNLAVSQCRRTQSGNTVTVEIRNPQAYTYRWKVGGQDYGSGQLVSCICAQSASVLVTRKADRLSIRKTVFLNANCANSAVLAQGDHPDK